MLQIYLKSFNLDRKSALVFAVIAFISGCATTINQPLSGGEQINLDSTPFFPQSDYQCGPAALTTILVSSGISVSPDELVDKVYIPHRKGALQIEMIAATRAFRRIPYILKPDFIAIIDELNQGRPVLVFQNLGWRIKPVWHYAVVIGYDPETETVKLRSGTTANARLSLKKFLQTWQRAQSWAFVALKPGELPANVNFNRYFQSLNDMSQNSSKQFMLELYQTATRQFADKSITWFALANSYLQLNEYSIAVENYLQVLALEPNHVAAKNNLAYGLSMLACYEHALEQADEAIRLSEITGQFESHSRDTLNQIKARMAQKNNETGNCEIDIEKLSL